MLRYLGHHRFFCKAFDRVDHTSLLSKFEKFADEKSVKWLHEYLVDRSISVKVNDSVSCRLPISCGVPQGSILAPILFSIFINDLPSQLCHSTVYLFADDVAVLYTYQKDKSQTENQSLLQSDLDACQAWARQVNGEFSPSKSCFFNSSMRERDYTVEKAPIKCVLSTKHLGVVINPALDFTQHFEEIYLKFRQRVHLLRHMCHRLPVGTVMLLYKGYVRPVVEYAPLVWCYRLTNSQLNKLDMLQASFIRTLLFKMNIQFDRYETKSTLNSLAKLESLQFRRHFMAIVYFFKLVHYDPEYLDSCGLLKSSSARRPNKFKIPRYKRFSSSLFLYKICRYWNCLPPNLTSLSNIVAFKSRLRRHYAEYVFATGGVPPPTC